MRYKLLFIIIYILYFVNHSGFAQDSITENNNPANGQIEYLKQPAKPYSLNKKEWEILKKKLKIKDYKPEKKKDIKSKKKQSFNIPAKWSLIIKWILFGILIGALLYLVLRVLGINPFTKKTDPNKINIALDEIEENLDTASIDPHLYDAIKIKNYKLAIRLYYLMIIQKLSLKEKIIWKKYKTNHHYLHELNGKNEYPVFKKLTYIYEKSWFGENSISETEYDSLNKDFVNFLQNIK
jgi:hypothetical protein